MLQQMTGFTLLESVLTLTLSSITTATALSYFNDWVSISEQTSLHYNQQVASYAMQTHQMWAKAKGAEAPKWSEVIQISGLESHVSNNGQLSLSNKSYCRAINAQGTFIKDC